MSHRKLESGSLESFAELNQNLLNNLLPEDIEYSQLAMNIINTNDGVDPIAVLEALRSFNFEVDSFNCAYKLRGFLYTDKYCLYWQIFYKNKFGALLPDVDAINDCDELDPFVHVIIHNKRDEWDEGVYWPNAALSNK